MPKKTDVPEEETEDAQDVRQEQDLGDAEMSEESTEQEDSGIENQTQDVSSPSTEENQCEFPSITKSLH